MAEKIPSAKGSTKKAAKKDPGKSPVFTDEERAAMKDYVAEKKAAARGGRGADKQDGESEVLANVAAMPGPDRALAERLHKIIKASAPDLKPRLWYGQPAYTRNGKVVCFFQSAAKFKTRYATFAFMHEASLDDGAMWPVAFALKELTAAVEAQISALVIEAAS